MAIQPSSESFFLESIRRFQFALVHRRPRTPTFDSRILSLRLVEVRKRRRDLQRRLMRHQRGGEGESRCMEFPARRAILDNKWLGADSAYRVRRTGNPREVHSRNIDTHRRARAENRNAKSTDDNGDTGLTKESWWNYRRDGTTDEPLKRSWEGTTTTRATREGEESIRGRKARETGKTRETWMAGDVSLVPNIN